MTRNGPQTAQAAVTELGDLLGRVPQETYTALCDELLAARRIVTYGVGREGLMMRALTMRLMHLGLDAHVVGDMTAPPVGAGDLLLVSAGPGGFSTVLGLQGVARDAGARVALVTAHPEGASAAAADLVVALPGPTMNPDLSVPSSALLMGSVFEIVQVVFYDVVAVLLTERLGQDPAEARRRHTNLE